MNIKQLLKKLSFLCVITLLTFISAISQKTIAEWNFPNGTDDATADAGTVNAVSASLIDDILIAGTRIPASLVWDVTKFNEAAANNGSISTVITLTLTNETFSMTGAMTDGTEFISSNVPAGLTMVVNVLATTLATASLTGNAISHTDADDIADLGLTFNNEAFTGGDAAAVTGSTQSAIEVDFLDPYPELAWSGTTFDEEAANNGSISTVVTLTLTGETFTVPGSVMTDGAEYTHANVPAGLTMVVTGTSTTTATVELTGDATAHTDADDVADMCLTFNNAAFTGDSASSVVNSSNTALVVDFNNPDPPVLAWSDTAFVEAAANDGSIPTVISLTLVNETFTVSGGMMTDGTEYTSANVPAGLTMVVTGTSTTTATVELTGDATAHTDANDIVDLILTFVDAAFTGGDASAVTGSFNTTLVIDFFDQPDIGVISLLYPAGGCGLTTEDITIEILNIGTLSVSDFDVSYSIDDGAPVTEQVSSVLNAGETLEYTFATQVDFSVSGTYIFDAWTGVVNDQYADNDSLLDVVINSIPMISTFPYLEDFEAGEAFWAAGGTNSTWEFGAPDAQVINSAASGVNAWVTNLSGDYDNNEVSYVSGPCIDLSGIIYPVFEINVFYQFPWNTGAFLEISTNEGDTWETITEWSGTVDDWTFERYDISDYSGNIVNFRIFFEANGWMTDEGIGFDDIHIYENADSTDLAIIGWQPLAGCDLTDSEPITVQVRNIGLDTASAFDLSYSIDNGVTWVTENITQALISGDTLVHTFATTADMSAPATYQCFAAVSIADDANSDDDTLYVEVMNMAALNTFPYMENFETFTVGETGTLDNGWSATAVTGNYAWYVDNDGTPTNGTGPSVDHTLGTADGIYMYSEASNSENEDIAHMISPCFDISGLVNPNLEFWYHMRGLQMGGLYLDIFDGTSWTEGVAGLQGQQQGSGNDPWLNVIVNLSDHPDMQKFRFRGVRGDGSRSDMAVDDIRIVDCGDYSVDLGPDVEACDGDIITLDADSAETYLWSDGSEEATLDVTEAGTYSVTVTFAGCSASDTIEVTFFDNPVVDFGPDIDTCIGDVVILDPGAFVSYIWYDGSTDQTLDVTETGTYGVIITDDNGCVGEDSVTITFNAPTPDIGQDFSACEGETITMDAGTYTFYLWSDGSTDQTLDVTVAGDYSVIVTDADGCTGVDTITVTFSTETITVDIGPDQTACESDEVILDAGYGDAWTYLWSDGSTDQTLDVTTTGEYVVTVSVYTCTGADTANVTIHASPPVDLGEDQEICGGYTVVLDAGDAGIYLWSDGSTGQILLVLTSGTYSVEVTDTNGCTNSDTVGITVFPAPDPDIGPDMIACDGETITLDPGTFDSYMWPDGSTDQTIEVSVTGDYSVTVTNTEGCTGTDAMTVTIVALPTVDLGGINDTLSVDLPYTIVPAVTGAIVAYLWHDNSTGTIYNATGNGWVYVTVTDAYGCTGEDSVYVNDADAIDDLVNDNENIFVYPNPNKGKFNIRIDMTGKTDFTIEIINLDGQVIYDRYEYGITEFEAVIDMSHLPKGIYIARINTGKTVKVQKVIIQ